MERCSGYRKGRVTGKGQTRPTRADDRGKLVQHKITAGSCILTDDLEVLSENETVVPEKAVNDCPRAVIGDSELPLELVVVLLDQAGERGCVPEPGADILVTTPSQIDSELTWHVHEPVILYRVV